MFKITNQGNLFYETQIFEYIYTLLYKSNRNANGIFFIDFEIFYGEVQRCDCRYTPSLEFEPIAVEYADVQSMLKFLYHDYSFSISQSINPLFSIGNVIKVRIKANPDSTMNVICLNKLGLPFLTGTIEIPN